MLLSEQLYKIGIIMVYKGYNFRKSKTIIQLYQPDPEKREYVAFGKVYPEGKSPTNAVPSQYTWPSGATVYAKYIRIKGHSLTNMAYGEDGRVYLMLDGKFYTAKMKGAK